MIRALLRTDAEEAHALVRSRLSGTAHEPRMRELLDLALRGDGGTERAGIVALVGGSIGGLVLYGSIAGSRAVRVDAPIGVEPRLGTALLDAVRDLRPGEEAAMLVCELPDEPAFAGAAEALLGAGFAVEGTIPDYVRDGVGLRLFVRRRSGEAP